ncbi:MAG: hypothetical protein H6701_17070 [Myxococcales bacterium]|nr:hypothetical protein [Myxococcales bacterium]
MASERAKDLHAVAVDAAPPVLDTLDERKKANSRGATARALLDVTVPVDRARMPLERACSTAEAGGTTGVSRAGVHVRRATFAGRFRSEILG